MKPLQKILAIKSIASNLVSRGLSYDEVFSYLSEYSDEVTFHQAYSWDNLEQYISTQCSKFSDDTVSIIYEELTGSPLADYSLKEDTSFWRAGYYKMFVSHLTKDKQSISYLKKCLARFGVDCFVAHEDIEPTKEWIKEIRNALNTADCLCAVFSPGFCESRWCDQEIGTALGRNIPTISVSKGADPHGFLSEFQAIKASSTANEVAEGIFKALCLIDAATIRYYPILGNLLSNSESEDEAIQWLNVIEKAKSFDESIIARVYDNYKANPVLVSDKVIPRLNILFKRIKRRANKPITVDYSDLPF